MPRGISPQNLENCIVVRSRIDRMLARAFGLLGSFEWAARAA